MSTPRRRPEARPAEDLPSSPPFVGALLRVAWLSARRRINAAVRAAGFTDLDDVHIGVFQYPVPDAVRPADLARRVGISRQAMNHLLSQLESLGYVERRAPAGGTRRLVFLTARGEQIKETIFAAMRQLQEDWASRAGRARFIDFVDVLRQVPTD